MRGLTKREHTDIEMMKAFASNPEILNILSNESSDYMAHKAVYAADAMLSALELEK